MEEYVDLLFIKPSINPAAIKPNNKTPVIIFFIIITFFKIKFPAFDIF